MKNTWIIVKALEVIPRKKSKCIYYSVSCFLGMQIGFEVVLYYIK